MDKEVLHMFFRLLKSFQLSQNHVPFLTKAYDVICEQPFIGTIYNYCFFLQLSKEYFFIKFSFVSFWQKCLLCLPATMTVLVTVKLLLQICSFSSEYFFWISTFSLSLLLSLIHSQTHSLLSFTLFLSLSHSLSHTHTHTHNLTPLLVSFTLFLSLSLSLSLTHTHTISLSLNINEMKIRKRTKSFNKGEPFSFWN